MVEIIGTLEDTNTEENRIIDTWRLPAFTPRQAELQGRGNARIKGRKGFSVQSVEAIEEGRIPGQSIYRVTVVSER